MKKYFIITYGCQMNISDSERIIKLLESFEYKSVRKASEADLVMINMCSVRQSAVDRVWGETKTILNLKSKNPKLISVLTGCILKKDRCKFAERFDLVLNIRDLPSLPKLLRVKRQGFKVKDYLKIQPRYQSEFSAFVPIMTGCNNFCTYCVVPYTRGRESSRSAKEIINEIKDLIKKKYKEIWLLGQNVNSYKDGKIIFPELLKMINDIGGEFWIRFVSPHPKDFSHELIRVMAECRKVTEYLNLPVQSGDDQILRKMNRPYTVAYYKNLVKKIRGKIPEISLSTDVIVGFPGETKKQFENTAKLFKEIKFDMAYIAKYSPRAGTVAEKLKDDVSLQEKGERYRTLTKILRQTALENNKNYIGKETEVLINKSEDNIYLGKTRTYKTVKIKSSVKKGELMIKSGQFVKMKIINALPWGLKGVFM